MTSRQQVGANVKAARLARGKSGGEVAQHLGVSNALYSRYESGSADLSPEQLRSVASLLDYTADALLSPTFARDRLADATQESRAGIAERIVSSRKAHGWTQTELAKHSGVSLHNIGAYETGTLPPPEKLKMIAVAVGKPLGYFYDGRLPGVESEGADPHLLADLMTHWEEMTTGQREALVKTARAIAEISREK